MRCKSTGETYGYSQQARRAKFREQSITVKNVEDLTLVRKGYITEKDVRAVTLNALVDTGATTLIINDEICNQLGLETVRTRTVNLAIKPAI